MQPRVYLAGPDVFLPDPLARAAAQKRICAKHGLIGVSPLDPLADEPAAWADLPAPHRIARRNEAHIRGARAVLANLTPFRGPSADCGTVYEVGFARALGLPVFGYTYAADDYAARVRTAPGEACDADGMAIEDFGLADNLMVACGIEACGGGFICVPDHPWRSMAAFKRATAQAGSALVAARCPV